MIHGRTNLSPDDLPMVARVTISSMPAGCAPVFAALVQKGAPLTVEEVRVALNVKHPDTARKVMETLDRRTVMEYVEEGAGKSAYLRFRPEWDWCASPEFRSFLTGEPVKNRGVCVSPVTSNLAQRQEEEAHTPQKMTSEAEEYQIEDDVITGSGIAVNMSNILCSD